MRNPLPTLWHFTLSARPDVVRYGRVAEGLPRKTIVAAITLYQHTLSPDHGPLKHVWRYGYCRHDPTCSEYGRQVILERGAVIGSLLAFKRILTCHPWRKPSPERIMRASHGRGE